MNNKNNQEKTNKKKVLILTIVFISIIILSFIVFKLFINKKEDTIDESKYISYVSSVDRIYDGKEHGIALEVKEGNKVKYGLSEGEYNLDESPKRSKPGKTVVYYQITTHDNKVITGSKEIIIKPKENKLKLSSTSAEMKSNSSLSIDVIENESKGSISCESTNTSMVTCSIEENKIVIKTLDIAGTTKVIIKSEEIEEYASSSIDFNINILEKSLVYNVSGYNAPYDGKNHGINIVSEGATIKYGLKENEYNLDESPTRKDPGTTKVYYQISKKGYKTVTDSEEITISKVNNTLTLSETKRTFTYPVNATFKVTKNTSGGKLTCTSSNKDIATCSIEKNIVKIVSTNKTGNVEFTIKSEATNQYNESSVIYKATISNGTLSYKVSGYNNIYDGNAHGINVVSEGATIKYGLKEGEYNLDKSPTRTQAGTTKVYYQITRPGFNKKTGSEDIIIRKADGNVTFKNEDKVIGKNEKIEIDISNPTGSLSCVSRNQKIATCSINNDKLVINGLGYGNTVIELRVNESNNYKSTTKEIKVRTIIKCKFNGNLVQGAEYVNGEYTYRYKQEGTASYEQSYVYGWANVKEDGWGVILTDKDDSIPVTTPLCTTINDKPIVSMSAMFFDTRAEEIDFSSFDTSNVTNMSLMFRSARTETLDLSGFDTSKVRNMRYMFQDNKASSLDLSSFNTSNVTNMKGMFAKAMAPSLNVRGFNTSKVTDMSYMFYNTLVTSLDLSHFVTNNVTNMSYMFYNSNAASLDLSKFNTSKVTDMSNMFEHASASSLNLSSFDTSNVVNMSSMFRCSEASSLNLSSFDTSKVTDMSNMFTSTQATTGYARTQADADKFNSSSNKPDGLNFVVKP